MFADMQAQMAELSPAVQMWLNWMTLCWLSSLLFAWNHTAARWVLAIMFPLTLPLGLVIFALSGTVHLLGIAHLIAWTPLLIYLVKNELRSDQFNPGSLYGAWVILLSATLLISLVFDVRDVTLVALGQK